MAAVALICMAMTSAVFTSCTEEKTTVVTEKVYYKYDSSKLYVADGQEATFTAFAAEMGEILTGNSYTDISESELIQRDGETGYNRKAFVKDLPLIRKRGDIDIISRDCGKNIWRYSIGALSAIAK